MFTEKSKAIIELRSRMLDFGQAYRSLLAAVNEYDYKTQGKGTSDILAFCDKYPFDKSFDELDIDEWVEAVVEEIDLLRLDNWTLEEIKEVLADKLDDAPSASVEDAIHLIMPML